MRLAIPSIQFKESFLQALQEFQAEPPTERRVYYDLDIKTLNKNFQQYIDKINSQTQENNIPHNYVPQSTYWLIDNDEFIGRVSIRHTLSEQLLKFGGHIGYDIRPSKRNMGYGKKILKLALPKSRELGITKALVTCDETNIGSKKVIEANGGVLENKLQLAPDKPAKLRYWIKIL